MNESLTEARARVAAVRSEKAEATAAEQRQMRVMATEQEKYAALKQQHSHLPAKLAEAERALAAAEDAALEQLNIERAAEIVKLQASDPIKNCNTVMALVEKLREGIRPAIHTPINKINRPPHPVIRQALALMPEPDLWETPISSQLTLDWSAHRRAILSEAFPESPPLQAA